MNQDSSVGIATGYGLDDNSESRRGQEFSLLHVVRLALGPPHPPVQWVPGVKRPGRETDRSPPPNADVMKTCAFMV
jgi:hypothetical protein